MEQADQGVAYEAGCEVKPAALSTDRAVSADASWRSGTSGKVNDMLNSKMPVKSGVKKVGVGDTHGPGLNSIYTIYARAAQQGSGALQLLVTALEPRTQNDFAYKVLEGLKDALASKPSTGKDRVPQPLAHILEDPASYDFVLIKQDYETVIRTVEDLYKRLACGCVHVHLGRPSEVYEDCGAFMLEKTAVKYTDVNHNGCSTSIAVVLRGSAEEEDEPIALLAEELDDLIANLEHYGHEDGVGVSEEAVGDLDNLVYYVSLIRSSAVEGDVRCGGAHAWQYPLMVRLPPVECFSIQQQVHFCRTFLPDYLERCGTAEALACSGESRDEDFLQVYLRDQAGAAMSSSAMAKAGGFNAEAIQSILEMGFDRLQAEDALRVIWPSSSVELALNWLLEGDGSSTPETVAPFWPPIRDEQKPPAASSPPPPSSMPRLTAAVDIRSGPSYGSDCGLNMPGGGLSRERPGLPKSDRVAINGRWDSQAMADSHNHAPLPPPPPSSPSLTCSSVPRPSSSSMPTSMPWFPWPSSSSFTSSASASTPRSLPVNYSPDNDGMIDTAANIKFTAAVKPASRSMLKRAEPEGVLGARTPLPFLPPPPFSEDRRDPRPLKKIARADHADLKRPSLDDYNVPLLKAPASDMPPGAFSDDRPLKKMAHADLKNSGARGHHHSRTCISALAPPGSSSSSSSTASCAAATAPSSSASSPSLSSTASLPTTSSLSSSTSSSLSAAAAAPSSAPATTATPATAAAASITSSSSPSSSSPPSPSSSSYPYSLLSTVKTLLPVLPPSPPIVLRVDPVRLVKVGAVTERARDALKEKEGGVAAKQKKEGGCI